jgi:nitrite reductase (NADH) small subunit
MLEFFKAAAVESLLPGHGRTVCVQGRQFALFNMDGRFYAMDDRCPHRGESLGGGILENGRVYCPMHGWEFDPATGGCLSNEERPVKVYPTRVRDGEVEIGIETE